MYGAKFLGCLGPGTIATMNEKRRLLRTSGLTSTHLVYPLPPVYQTTNCESNVHLMLAQGQKHTVATLLVNMHDHAGAHRRTITPMDQFLNTKTSTKSKPSW